MKKLCEANLAKVSISEKNEMLNQIYQEAHRYDCLKDAAYSVTATIAGFGTTAINNLLGTDLRNVGVFEDYQKAYYGGTIAGDIASTIIGAAETVLGLLMTAIGMTGTVGGIAITSTGVGIAPELAISGAGVVVSAAGVAVTEAGTATLGRSSNSLSDNIQNFKDSGTSGSSKPSDEISNEVRNISEKRKDHIIEESKNSDHHWERLVKDKNWNDIQKIIDKTMKEGVEVPYKAVNSKVLNINGEKVQVVYNTLEDGTKTITDAWVAN